ncbi:hypothetical protein HAX54_003839 [Datura stramonium]|uniref:Uncharacterized protein n=1 Tax=Datura stramonium TaxID=4076 RepID=A0ABS8T6R5_DATST|nr:hypothetical protein [Datura stramonium]
MFQWPKPDRNSMKLGRSIERIVWKRVLRCRRPQEASDHMIKPQSKNRITLLDEDEDDDVFNVKIVDPATRSAQIFIRLMAMTYPDQIPKLHENQPLSNKKLVSHKRSASCAPDFNNLDQKNKKITRHLGRVRSKKRQEPVLKKSASPIGTRSAENRSSLSVDKNMISSTTGGGGYRGQQDTGSVPSGLPMINNMMDKQYSKNIQSSKQEKPINLPSTDRKGRHTEIHITETFPSKRDEILPASEKLCKNLKYPYGSNSDEDIPRYLKLWTNLMELAVHPYATTSIGYTKTRSLDNLIKQLCNDFDTLKSLLNNGDMDDECDAADYLHKMIGKDIQNGIRRELLILAGLKDGSPGFELDGLEPLKFTPRIADNLPAPEATAKLLTIHFNSESQLPRIRPGNHQSFSKYRHRNHDRSNQR